MSIGITSFYIFDQMSEEVVNSRAEQLKTLGQEWSLKGLILLGTEGFNLTVSGTDNGILALKNLFFVEWNYKNILLKDSRSFRHPFKHYRIQIRKEIVTLGVDSVQVPQGCNNHLSPTEWEKKIESGEVTLLDTRNWYETELGKFKNAKDFNLKEFSDFPQALEKSLLPKDKDYLIYCTGGIRCEKAMEEMRRQGFDKIHQLEGGILKYIEEYPNRNFDGECFVFDHRVALDQNLQPSQTYRLCPHCGQPGSEKIVCLRCSHPSTICSNCSRLEYNRTCSKNCANHYRVRPGQKGPHQEESTLRDF